MYVNDCITNQNRKSTGIGYGAEIRLSQTVLDPGAFRQEIPRLSPDFHFVVIARPALTECSFADVRRDLRYLFKKAGVLLPAAGDRS